MHLINKSVEQYAEDHTSPETDLLKKLSEFTTQKHSDHHMLSGHVQGKLLSMISCMIKPHRILEIGTFTGYSALSLATGLATDGQLHTIELKQENADDAKRFFAKSNFHNQIISHCGNALEIIPELNEVWDLVFIDADKIGYINYFNIVLPNIKQGGFILADNTFFHGQVLEQPVKGKNAKAMQEFNTYINQRNDIEKLMLTVRDGLYLLRKL